MDFDSNASICTVSGEVFNLENRSLHQKLTGKFGTDRNWDFTKESTDDRRSGTFSSGKCFIAMAGSWSAVCAVVGDFLCILEKKAELATNQNRVGDQSGFVSCIVFSSLHVQFLAESSHGESK